MSTHDKRVSRDEAHKPGDGGATGIETTDKSQDNQARVTLSGILVPYLKSSFGLVIWFLFVSCGGVVFAVYYARIGYLPDIELNSAVFYLAAASLLGGSLVILLTLLLIVPGYIWATYLTSDPNLKGAFCDGKLITEVKFLKRLILWFLSFALVWHLILIYSRWWYLLLIALAGGKAWGIWKRELQDCTTDAKTKPAMFASYALRYGASVMFGLMAIFILFKLLGLSDTKYELEHLVICTVGVVIGNSFVAVFLHGGKRPGAIVSAIVVAVMLLAATDYFDPVPNKILLKYGFGVEHVRIIVNEDAYRALQAGAFVEGDDVSQGPKVISDVQILCRMGPNYFLKKGTKNMAIAKSAVISWSVGQNP